MTHEQHIHCFGRTWANRQNFIVALSWELTGSAQGSQKSRRLQAKCYWTVQPVTLCIPLAPNGGPAVCTVWSRSSPVRVFIALSLQLHRLELASCYFWRFWNLDRLLGREAERMQVQQPCRSVFRGDPHSRHTWLCPHSCRLAPRRRPG
jgi:hypothetical protein